MEKKETRESEIRQEILHYVLGLAVDPGVIRHTTPDDIRSEIDGMLDRLIEESKKEVSDLQDGWLDVFRDGEPSQEDIKAGRVKVDTQFDGVQVATGLGYGKHAQVWVKFWYYLSRDSQRYVTTALSDSRRYRVRAEMAPHNGLSWPGVVACELREVTVHGLPTDEEIDAGRVLIDAGLDGWIKVDSLNRSTGLNRSIGLPKWSFRIGYTEYEYYDIERYLVLPEDL